MRSYRIAILVFVATGIMHYGYVISPFEMLPDKGIFFETFDECPANCTVIDASLSYGYTVENGRVKIEISSYIYDRDYYYPLNNWAFYRNNANPLFLLNMWIEPDILILIERKLSALDPDYESIASVDNISFESESNWGFFIPFQHFRFKITQPVENITGVILHWYGSTNGKKLRIYVWNGTAFHNIGRWKLHSNIEGNTTSMIVNETIPKSCITNKTLDIILAPLPAESSRTFIRTNYISLEIRKMTTQKAFVITMPFEIDNNSRWEYVEWDGQTSDNTNITLQILDENGKVLGEDLLEGNTKGFQSKRVVLVDLNVRKIRLKFKLETRNPLESPSLDDFLLLWQLNRTRWEDDLSTDYRIEKKSSEVIISKPIFLPSGYWWSDFEAFAKLNGGKITFSVLDLDGSPLVQNISGKSETKYNISSVASRAIRLKAEIEGVNGSLPEIEKWSVTYFKEEGKPLLKYPEVIFISEEDKIRGKIDVTILAMDSFSGICKTSGRYRLHYTENETGNIINTSWLPAEIDAENGTTSWVNVTARDIPIFYDDSLKDLLGLEERKEIRLSGIDFRVEDMAGNSNGTEIIDIQVDVTPPTSWITTKVEDVGFKHNGPVEITANATDDLSNIKKVTLYYRTSSDNKSFSDPIKYGAVSIYPWKWLFVPEESAYYKFFTVAEDNAGNKESMKEGELTLLIDINAPEKPQFSAGVHWLNSSKINFVTFSDDFCINKIEYKIGEGYFEWRTISSNVNSTTYTDPWYIDAADWDRMSDGETYPIYFRVTDIVGNEYETESYVEALIVGKDITPPKPFLNPIKVWQWKLPVRISCYIPENGSGITSVKIFYRYSTDNETWSDWKEYNATLFSGWHNWSFDPVEGDGYYEIKVEAVDAAGNHAVSDIIRFGLTRFPGIETSILIFLFTILILLSAIFIKKWD